MLRMINGIIMKKNLSVSASRLFSLGLLLLLLSLGLLLAGCQKIRVDLAETEEPSDSSKYTVSADLNTAGGAPVAATKP
jgi:hypothetical protein